MEVLYRIQAHIIERIKFYTWDYKCIRQFNTHYEIYECYKPDYLIIRNGNLLIGSKGHEVLASELDIFILKNLLRYVIKTQRNKQ